MILIHRKIISCLYFLTLKDSTIFSIFRNYYSSEDTIRVRTQLRFQFYNEDSIRVGTLYECGLYLRLYGTRCDNHFDNS